ncbi:AraC family transcriptional regulator [Pleomorphomonas oryzae]|uniref:AraC family transcriptional regulator n=1 Tax=Pleomorphomonas oryzae TaxID=261934 RepID=UPI0003F68DA2|nr:helix-turn-helix transcriptional regulator [Pleomorphomonas oryzae]
MTDFLIDPLLLQSTEAPILLATSRRQAGVRHTERHSHGRGQLLGTLRGVVSIRTDQSRWLIPPVNAVWLPPHVEHDFISHGSFQGWSVYVAEEACDALPGAPRVIRLSGLLNEAVARAAGWDDKPLSPAEINIARVILDEIAAAPEEDLELPMPRDARLRRIAQAIAEGGAERRRMPEWAAWAGIAPRSLSRRFTEETGLTFSAWRRRVMLLRSLEMLAEGNPVTTVALDLGYETVSAFIEAFQAQFGTTPGRYFK